MPQYPTHSKLTLASNQEYIDECYSDQADIVLSKVLRKL